MLPTAPTELNSVAVCVSTMHRPFGLTQLLHSLNRLKFVKVRTPAVVLIVCDNDPDQSAAETVARFARDNTMSIQYLCERRRGISFARNSCIRAALAFGSDAVALIDDDEIADPLWLDELLAARQEFNAHVVTGPVRPVYEEGIPQWMIHAGLFARPDRVTGTLLTVAAAGNALVVREVLETVGPFDARFALSGGEDTHFFWRARAKGAVIAWANSAVVHETVPVSRARVSWLIQRAGRLQNSYVFCERELLPVKHWILQRMAKTAAISARGLGRIVIAPIGGRSTLVRGLCDLARALGAAVGACGSLYQEYRTLHGR